jgi:hypothetical protein
MILYKTDFSTWEREYIILIQIKKHIQLFKKKIQARLWRKETFLKKNIGTVRKHLATFQPLLFILEKGMNVNVLSMGRPLTNMSTLSANTRNREAF